MNNIDFVELTPKVEKLLNKVFNQTYNSELSWFTSNEHFITRYQADTKLGVGNFTIRDRTPVPVIIYIDKFHCGDKYDFGFRIGDEFISLIDNCVCTKDFNKILRKIISHIKVNNWGIISNEVIDILNTLIGEENER